jgi:hypothetical protein
MKSNIILDRLVEESNTINDLINFDINHIEREEHLENALYHFTLDFNELYKTSVAENFYWEYCSFETYLMTFESRLMQFLNSMNDLIALDFFNSEISKIEKYYFNNKPLWLKQKISINNYLFDLDFSKLRDDLLSQIDVSNKRKIEFLKYKIDNFTFEFENMVNITEDLKIQNKPINKFPKVFVDDFSFLFFEQLYENYKNTKTRLADFSFIYRKMVYDKHIHEDFKPEMFKNWVAKAPYARVIDGGLKVLEHCTTKSKEIAYRNIKENINF